MKDWRSQLVVTLVIAALALLFGYKLKPTEIQYIERVETDTLYVSLKDTLVEYEYIQAKPETLYIHETIASNIGARMDTTLWADRIKYGGLTVWHYYPPFERFALEFRPEPLPVIYKTTYITTPRKWHESRLFNMGVGLVVGAVIVRDWQVKLD